MKLIFCRNCHDVFKLSIKEERQCECGSCVGKYTDDLNAYYKGEDAVPLGINNFSLGTAISNQPLEGLGKNFGAFVIPKICKTFNNKNYDT